MVKEVTFLFLERVIVLLSRFKSRTASAKPTNGPPRD